MCFARSQAEWLKGRKGNAALSAMSDSSGDDEAVHVFERYSDSAAAVARLRCSRTCTGRDVRHSSIASALLDLERRHPELRQLLDPFSARYFAPLAGFSRGSAIVTANRRS